MKLDWSKITWWAAIFAINGAMWYGLIVLAGKAI
jgi:hypothetical protein